MVSRIDPIESYRPALNDPCFCHSKKRFKDCCGRDHWGSKSPREILIKKAFLPAKSCEKLVSYAAKQEHSDLAVVTSGSERENDLATSVNSDRLTTRIELGAKQSLIDGWVSKVFHSVVSPTVKQKIRSYTPPDLMRYDKGGFYKPHSDSEMFDRPSGKWNKVLDRDYSLLLYLNGGFEGGEVFFNYLNFTYRPEAGDLLVFPSDSRYLHEAKTVLSGTKFVIVSWAAVR